MIGIYAGFLWGDNSVRTVVYTDRGISSGMQAGIERAQKKERPVIIRKLGPNWEQEHDEFVKTVRDKGLF